MPMPWLYRTSLSSITQPGPSASIAPLVNGVAYRSTVSPRIVTPADVPRNACGVTLVSTTCPAGEFRM